MTAKRRTWFPAIAVAVLTFTAAAWPAGADTRIDKELKLEPGGKLILDADAGSVTIKGSSRAGARIVVTSKRDDLQDKYDFTFEEGPGTVTVTARKKGTLSSWFTWSGAGSPSFEIEVPTRTAVRIDTGGGHVEAAGLRGDAEIETAGGHIEISDLTGKLLASTSGGHITLSRIDGDSKVETSGGHIESKSLKGALHAQTSGGHINLGDVTGDINAHSSGGHIQITGAGGRVDADTSGGSVSVSFAPGNEKGGNLETSGGSVEVRVDGGANLNVDAETGGGSVRSSLPITGASRSSRSSLKGSLGKGGQALVIRTSAGSIEIGSI